MKRGLVIIAVMLALGGCSFRDGAATTAAGLSSVMWTTLGVPGTYGDDKEYWNEKLGVSPELPDRNSPIMKDDSNSTKTTAQNQ